METDREQAVAETWEDIWKKIKLEKWDKQSESIYQVLLRETFCAKSRFMLEAGSGTGRISCKLREIGKGDVALLDVSKTAIQISRKVFEERDQTAFFILGSIFEIPVKDDTFDLVYNAGVLEHFSESERSLALKEARAR